MTSRQTAECLYCGKPIALNREGFWGARKRDDPHPWYCDQDTGPLKLHEPTGQQVIEEG